MITEIQKKEEIVISWLRSHGYFRVVTAPNHLAIEADGKMRRMMVTISITGASNNIEQIKKLASETNREAWLAVVEPEDNDITWSILK